MKTYCLALSILFAVPALATPPAEISAFLGFGSGGKFEEESNDTEFDLDDGTIGSVALHLASRRGGHYEFSYWREDTSLQSGGVVAGSEDFDVTAEYFQFGGTLPVGDARTLKPYVAMTIGISRYNPEDNGFNTETFFALTGGGGVRMDLSERLSVKFEIRALVSWFDSGTEYFCANSADGAVCAIQSSGDAVVRWTGGAGIALRF